MNNTRISVQVAAKGEYPPGEEWRSQIREAIEQLYNLPDDQWIKVIGIEPSLVNRARSAAHSYWGDNDEWKLVTKYDSQSNILWMTSEKIKTEYTE